MKKFSMLIITTIVFLMTAQTVFAGTPTTSTKDTPVVSAQPSKNENSWENKKALGVTAFGYYELNSDWPSLYFSFPADSLTTAGIGFDGFFEIGTSEKISIEIGLGYSRLLSSSIQRSTITESYFIADLLAHYHFYNTGSLDIYGIAGAGAYISSNSVAPMLDLGIGAYYKLAEGFCLKTEIIAKSAIVLNRAEARIGLAYQF